MCGCGRYNEPRGSIVAAHANDSRWGKGGSLKSHDFAVAYIHTTCHDWLDNSKSPIEDKDAMWLRAHINTMAWLFNNGYLVVKC